VSLKSFSAASLRVYEKVVGKQTKRGYPHR
jgi:hypothetical protein